jgi:hypothetical protein
MHRKTQHAHELVNDQRNFCASEPSSRPRRRRPPRRACGGPCGPSSSVKFVNGCYIEGGKLRLTLRISLEVSFFFFS